MLGYLFLFLFFVVLVSCSGAGKVVTSSVSPHEIKEMSYFSPIYSKQNPEITKSKAHFYFLRATSEALDSIFEKKPVKYRISEKINVVGADMRQRIYSGINTVFREIHKNKNIQNIKIPMAIRSNLKKHNTRFALALLISPDFILSRERYPNAIIINYKRNSYSVKSSTVHAVIFDLEKNNVAFYRKVSGVQNLGYSKRLINDLNLIFKSYFY